MENKDEMNVNATKIRFSAEEEQKCFINFRSQLIKLLYMIEKEQRGEGDIGLWFYGFMFELASANSLCDGKLLKVVIKIHGLYDNNSYKTMTHDQIKRQIMEAKGVLDHLIGDKH